MSVNNTGKKAVTTGTGAPSPSDAEKKSEAPGDPAVKPKESVPAAPPAPHTKGASSAKHGPIIPQQEQNQRQVIVIGAVQQDGRWQACDSKTTRRQVEEVSRLSLPSVIDETTNAPLGPDAYDNLYAGIVRDRKLRIDRHTPMADRPPLLVIVAVGGTICQIDWFHGHDFLRREPMLGVHDKEFDAPDFTDPNDAGIRLDGFGIVAWRGDFQRDLTDRRTDPLTEEYRTEAIAELLRPRNLSSVLLWRALQNEGFSLVEEDSKLRVRRSGRGV